VRPLSYSDTGLTASTLSTYAVSAFDAAGNDSASATTSATTFPDTTPPTVAISSPANGEMSPERLPLPPMLPMMSELRVSRLRLVEQESLRKSQLRLMESI
jgi:hypothetical protein